jgi:hypothetical protein
MAELSPPRLLDAQQMELVERFAASVAHALGNPLTILMLAAERFTRCPDCASRSAGEGAWFLDETGRIAQIHRFLLEAADPGPEVVRPIDVNAAARQAVALMQDGLRLHGVEPVLTLAPDAIHTQGDPLLLTRALLDLGGTLSAGATRLEIRTRRQQRLVEILVALHTGNGTGAKRWDEVLTVWRDDGSPGTLWRAWQFAYRQRGHLELRFTSKFEALVILRWPERSHDEVDERTDS